MPNEIVEVLIHVDDESNIVDDFMGDNEENTYQHIRIDFVSGVRKVWRDTMAGTQWR